MKISCIDVIRSWNTNPDELADKQVLCHSRPDYSWSQRGIKGSRPAKNNDKVDPKEVDAYVDTH
jgi:hypothetical protein